jgi:predicted dehydrogenase
VRDGTFGIGIVGCGEISAAHNRAYRELGDPCAVVARGREGAVG